MLKDLEYIRGYKYDFLATTSASFMDDLDKLDLVLNRLRKLGLKCNAVKSNSCRKEVKCLAYLLTRKGIKLQPKKRKYIHKMVSPKTRK